MLGSDADEMNENEGLSVFRVMATSLLYFLYSHQDKPKTKHEHSSNVNIPERHEQEELYKPIFR